MKSKNFTVWKNVTSTKLFFNFLGFDDLIKAFILFIKLQLNQNIAWIYILSKSYVKLFIELLYFNTSSVKTMNCEVSIHIDNFLLIQAVWRLLIVEFDACFFLIPRIIENHHNVLQLLTVLNWWQSRLTHLNTELDGGPSFKDIELFSQCISWNTKKISLLLKFTSQVMECFPRYYTVFILVVC